MSNHGGLALRKSGFVVAGFALVSLFQTAAISGPAKVVAGTLTCKGKGTVGLILGSKETLACTFQTPKGVTRSYSAVVTKIGLDVGVKGKSVMVWTVLGSTTDLAAGALAGKYAGVSANAAVGVGAGANALVGGSNDSVVLQPLSVQGQTGLNLAIGISGLALRHNE